MADAERKVTGTTGRYIAVLRAPSAAILPPDYSFQLQEYPSATGAVSITLRTRYVDDGYEVPLPRDLWVEVQGFADSIDDAAIAFTNAARSVASLIVLSTNASIDNLELELVYDNTPGKDEHEYFQTFLLDRSYLPRKARRINVEASVGLINAIGMSPECERLLRAVGQYHMALMHWRLGEESLALAHLYMGMEALVKVVIRIRCQKEGVTEQELALKLGVNLKDLDSTVRRLVLFQGDEKLHQIAKKASDGFEHGFIAFHDIRKLAMKIWERLAMYLRSAIIDLSGLQSNYRDILANDPFATPLGLWSLVKYLRGHLIGEVGNLAAAGHKYPMIQWKTLLKAVSLSADGEYQITMEEKLTPLLNGGVEFRPQSLEVWGPGSTMNPTDPKIPPGTTA